MGRTRPALWTIPPLGEARFLPRLGGEAPDEACRQGAPVCLRTAHLYGDGGLEVEAGFNDLGAVAGDCIQQHEVIMTTRTLPPVDWLSLQAAVADAR